jgi:hypothetical protein
MRTINSDVNVIKFSKFHKALEPRSGLRGVPTGVEGRERLLPSIALSSGTLCNKESHFVYQRIDNFIISI